MSYIGTQPSYGAFEKQFYTGNGTNTVYNLDHVVNTASSLLVSVNGVILEPDVGYTVNAVGGSSNITFTTAPGNGHRIFIVYMGKQLLSAPEITPHIDEFNGDGSTSVFTLTKTSIGTPNGSRFLVFVDNVYQRYGSSYAYTVSGNTITFTGAPPTGTNNIQVLQLDVAMTNVINTVADGSITSVKIADGTVTKTDLAFDPDDEAAALAIALG